jgi:hypothetical protein
MPAYSLAVLLSAISFYISSVLVFRLSCESRLRWRSSVLLFLLGGFFFSTFCRTIAASRHQAELSILLIYAHAVFIPTLFFDFVSLYCLRSKLRRALLSAAYAASALLLGGLFTGNLITGVAPHRYFLYYGVPGPAYRFYLAFVAIFTLTPLFILCASYRFSPQSKTKATLFLIITSLIGILTTASTLLATFSQDQRPWLTYASFSVPALVLYSLARHRFLSPRLARPNLLAASTVLAVALVAFALLVSISEYVYFKA